MSDHIALYYPFLEFRNDSWVKFATLYWDKLGRIVPYDYKPHDSKVVRQLADELGFIVNFVPSDDDLEAVASEFFAVFRSHKEELVQHYGITMKHEVQLRPYNSAVTTASVLFSKFHHKPSLSVLERYRIGQLYKSLQNLTSNELKQKIESDPIARGMTEDLSFSLVHEGLAVPLYTRTKEHGREIIQSYGREIIQSLRIHSKLAFIYMSVLAERIASVRLLHPITDDMFAHLAINGYTLDRLIQALFEPEDLKPRILKESSRRWYEVETQMMIVALKAVMPLDITSVPTEKIIVTTQVPLKRHKSRSGLG